MKNKILSLLLVLVFTLSLASCSKKYQFDMDVVTKMTEGESYNLTATKEVVWESSDSTIARIENNKILALKPGTFILTATCGTGKKAVSKTLEITVVTKPVVKSSITYLLDGGNNPSNAPTEYTEGTGLESLPTPTKEGYNFLGWFVNDVKQENIGTSVTGNVILTAKWEKIVIKSSITYVLDGGNNPTNAPVEYTEGTGLESLPTPTKEGYNFLGWFVNDVKQENIDASVTGNVTLTAKWKKIVVKSSITYVLDGGTNETTAPVEYTEGTGLESLPTPTKEGYNFLGWFVNDVKQENIDASVTGNVTLTAKWEKIVVKSSITYVLDGGTNETTAPVEYTEGTGLTSLPLPTKEGYNFLGWFVNDVKQESISETQTGNIELTAKWEKVVVKSSITYVLDGGTNEATAPVEYTEGTGLTSLPLPTKEGYNFLGWFVNDVKQESISETQTGNITLTAKWEKDVVKSSITYVLDGGTNEAAAPVEYTEGTGLTSLPTPTKDGYRFIGWLYNKEIVTELNNEIVGEVTLTAKWRINDGTYDITYVVGEGVWPTRAAKNTAEVTEALLHEMYVWGKVTTTYEAFKTATMTKWKGGAEGSVKLYMKNGQDSINEGYFANAEANFEKWEPFIDALDAAVTKINGSQHAWDSTYVGLMRLYNILVKGSSYVTAEVQEILCNGCVISIEPITSYKLGDSIVLDSVVSPLGRNFLGWYDQDNNKVTDITSTMEKDLVLTAMWSDPVYPSEIVVGKPVSSLDTGIEHDLEISLLPNNVTHGDLIMTSSNELVATIKKGVITTIGYGQTEIIIKSVYKDEIEVKFTLTVTPQLLDEPVIYLNYDTPRHFVERPGAVIDLMSGVKALDAKDGDLTSKVEIVDMGGFDKDVEGEYTITYSVSNSDSVVGIFTRTVIITKITFIGHGGSFLGMMNTEEAMINAVTKKGYTALECDVKQTSDGVFVICHDDTIGGYTLASTTYATLKDIEFTGTRGGIEYTYKICTFARYLEICKQYGVKAVVELKSSNGITNSNTSRMDELMEEIKAAGMLNDVIFLGSQYGCLEWVRNNGYKNIPCQYLVTSADSQNVYDRCVKWDFDVSFNIEGENSKAWIEKYHAAGLKVSSYTFSQYSTKETLQKWINMGVDYVTCDVLVESDVTLPY